MKLFYFLASKTFWANVLVAALLCAAIFWGVSSFLDSYTRHGENVKVPDLSKLALNEAETELSRHDLSYAVIDSSEFDPTYPRGSVIAQYPEAGGLVKKGREIKLTLNPVMPRKIEIPNLIEKTKRRAVYDLESKGFEVGELQYVPYLGKDVVVDIKVEGRSIKLGEKFTKGTVVDLVLGEGLGDTRIRVPYLRWKSREEAESELQAKSLNVGSVIYDQEITDTALALVYRQYPEPTTQPAIKLGQEVDIWLTNEYTKIPSDSLKFQNTARPDSLYSDSLKNETTP